MIEKESPEADAAELDIEQFEYDLPPELIAQAPLPRREQSRLLALARDTGEIRHMHFENIVDVLKPGDLLVVNNTKVIPARLLARRASGGQVKMLLLKADAANPAIWEALVTPIKRIRPGELLTVETLEGTAYAVRVLDIFTGFDGFKRLRIDLGSRGDVFELLCAIGQAPLPPYIHRAATQGRSDDLARYQTVYATTPGAVAAPTAGLHFSQALLQQLSERGIEIRHITLHVGPGTFKPIEDSVANHTIEPETFSIAPSVAAAVNAARQSGRRIIAVGTTSLRALESSVADAQLQAATDASTSLYVKPGYQFQIVDALITNFHLSRSSLLVLVCDFAGRDSIMHAYHEAIAQRYRFFSYGDAMLII